MLWCDIYYIRKIVVADIMNPQLKFLDQVQDVLQGRYYSYQMEKSYIQWIGTCRLDRLNVAEWVNQIINLALFWVCKSRRRVVP